MSLSKKISSRIKQKVKKGSKSVSSRRWLERQLNDPYVKAAKSEGYRSRAAYKLIEIDSKYKIFKNKVSVLDLGGAPGGWSQVASNKIISSKKKIIVTIDIHPIEPLEEVFCIQGNILDDKTLEIIKNKFPYKTDVVISDMSPSSSGHKNTDQTRSLLLAEIALDVAINLLNINGNFCCKLIRGRGEEELVTTMRQYFKEIKRYKPKSSRKESAEIFIIGLNFMHQGLA